jgi:molybdopterin molybdotransferase
VLAEDILASVDLPPFPNSGMDGFAVRVADVSLARADAPVALRVVADIPAGREADIRLETGQAARIMTGAVVPEGAEAVIPVEDTDFSYRQAGVEAPQVVKIYRSTRTGDHIRPAGQDVRRGELILRAGTILRPQDAGILSMLGQAQVPVHQIPRVAIFSSGDELLPVEAELAAGKIHDANSYILISLVEQCGGQAIHLGIVPDNPKAVQDCLDRAVAERVHLILSSAGVSVGALDFVRSVVEQKGSLDFWRVNMRPGKPLAFGHYQGIPFIGLPGNPVSAYIGFEVFVRPALLRLQGMQQLFRPVWKVRLGEKIESDGRESYLRAIVERQEGELVARLTGHQGSGNLRSLVQANALLIVASGVKSLPSGAQVEAWILDQE